MKNISKETITLMDKIEKLNLINSCTGYKSANLIATKSIDGQTNVAIFSSVTHLGNSPSLIGFIVRPTNAPRDTYINIMETGYFTINHITIDMIADAHHTSANYDSGTSEFDKTNLEEEYKEGFNIPFVKGSPVQIYCKFVNEYLIKENDSIHIIASIEHIFFDEDLKHKDGWLQLDKGNIVTLSGIDGYFLPKLIDRFQPAQQDILTKPYKKDQ
ncbi:flavin reductase family protein [Flavobacterium gilvum]|uniref:Flavin oxidoreductase n=1 Tax=Flavobacterium gilvum TaxID=1492737 RepID=A0AAC9I439_9FLAO|nr:flavin reductase [Flavobacterium gilvum]AOW08318.1 flavin oxidoreductase [Flavobacterium gilvum]KFC59473.1 flavin oxidoreductase [Flavobacterium gilvum]